MFRKALVFGCLSFQIFALTASGYTWEQDTLAVRLTLNDNGLFATPVSQVATRINDRVQALRFDSLPLNALSFELFTLDSLKSLSMIHCGLKSIPPNIAQLNQLTSLNLSDNLLTSIPLEPIKSSGQCHFVFAGYIDPFEEPIVFGYW
jgi:Leucine-rich repeat (LRR) protein